MNFEPFYEQCQQLQKDQDTIRRFYDAVLAVFGDENPEFDNIDKVWRLVYVRRSGSGKSSFFNKKDLLILFYEWLFAQGAINQKTLEAVRELDLDDAFSEDFLRRFYFKNLDDALGFVTSIGIKNGLNDPRNDMLPLKTIVILAWYGANVKDITSMRKSDIDRSNHTIAIGNKNLALHPEHMSIVCRFADSDLHRGFPTPRLRVYVDSPYLMRSQRQFQQTAHNIKDAVHRFNDVAQRYGHEISLQNLPKNAIFDRVYNRRNEGKPINVIIREVTGCDHSAASQYRKGYEKWRHYIMEDDE